MNGELPKGWVETTLGDICQSLRNGLFVSRPSVDPPGIPIFRIRAVRPLRLDASDVRWALIADETASAFYVDEGDLLFTRYSGNPDYVGSCAVVPRLSQRTLHPDKLIRVRIDRNLADPMFVEIALNFGPGRRAIESRLKTTAGQVGIAGSQLLTVPIRLPPLAEQRRIVTRADEQTSRLFSTEQSLDRCQSRIRRARSSAIALATGGSWPLVPVRELTVLQQYGSSAKASAEGDVPMLRMGNVRDGRVVLDDLKFLPAHHPDCSKYELHRGDVLFNRTNSPELVGKAAVYEGSPMPAIFASYLIRIRLDERCVPHWLSFYLSAPGGRQWARSVVSQQVGQANINGSKLAALKIPLPPLDEQRRIVAEVERQLSILDSVKVAVDHALVRCGQLRRSILERAFTGRLVPQDPDDEPADVLLERIRAERATAAPPQKRRRGGATG